MKNQKKQSVYLAIVLAFILLASCASPSQQSSSTTQAAPTGCADKDCFISAANNCQELSVALNEDVGVFKYSSSKDCVFTKTLVTVNDNETLEMKKLLTGKSLECRYERGKFDERLVTSVLFGTEYCEGELKDVLGRLIVFV